MDYTTLNRGGRSIPVIKAEALVVGTGAASLNAAHELHRLGVDVIIVTEGIKMGTSRNTGSDKQTYYKLQLTGGDPDSVEAMAKSLFAGGSMQGDLALMEAANSANAFFKLVSLGVPFPQNEYGEFVGYRTDHDMTRRATSCGPLTSKYMTECLEAAVEASGISILDGARVIGMLKSPEGACVGAAAISADCVTEENPMGLIYINAGAVVYGVGGPSAIYASSVYPQSQTCAHGAAFMAGASGVNLTESQYGIASLDFRWNLSGSYQQVLPRYFSVDENGTEYDFLADAIPDGLDRLSAVFLKGYEWPFDPARSSEGSSRVDMAVYGEKMRGRRVFMDFLSNDSALDAVGYPENAKEYLSQSDAIEATPLDRLMKLNPKAYQLYLDHGIDLAKEPLEIGVCAQHNNGGLECDARYMSPTLANFYPIGEAAGIFGVRRPGGSALNSTQVSSMRAARSIAENRVQIYDITALPFDSCAEEMLSMFAPGNMSLCDILEERRRFGERMDKAGAFIRRKDQVVEAICDVKRELDTFTETHHTKDVRSFIELCINYDVLVTQYVYLSAIKAYIDHGGLSRGSYLIDGNAQLDTTHSGLVCRVKLSGGDIEAQWMPVRPIPESEQWFEKVYNRQK
ncbi:MAG: FAD-binding protein [Clostridia bacterium]|nr:FAD-binding protein [Clostridia bacterium]